MRIGAAGRVGRHDHGPAYSGGDGGLQDIARAVDVDPVEVGAAPGMDDAGDVEQHRAAGALAQPGAVLRAGEIAADDLDTLAHILDERSVLSGQDKAAHAQVRAWWRHPRA